MQHLHLLLYDFPLSVDSVINIKKKSELFSHLTEACKTVGQSSLAIQRKLVKNSRKKGKHKACNLIYLASSLSKIHRN